MENASNALIMAAGVLIGLMILSLAVYLFVTFGSTSAQMHNQKEQDQLNQFNSQFTSYEEKEDLTIYDVVSVANAATENNEYYDFDTDTNIPTSDNVNKNYIWVQVKEGSHLKANSYAKEKAKTDIKKIYEKLISDELDKINSDNDQLSNYSCKTSISSITGRVYKVIFTQK